MTTRAMPVLRRSCSPRRLPSVRPRTCAIPRAACVISFFSESGKTPRKPDSEKPARLHRRTCREGRDRRPVTGWVPARGEQAGLALAILIDDSSGISFGSQIEDLRAFIGEQAPTTLVALGYMQNGTVFVAQQFTQDHAARRKSFALAPRFCRGRSEPIFLPGGFHQELAYQYFHAGGYMYIPSLLATSVLDAVATRFDLPTGDVPRQVMRNRVAGHWELGLKATFRFTRAFWLSPSPH
jgi:hypothetical protein